MLAVGLALAAGVYLDDLDLHARAYRLAETQLRVAMPVLRDGWECGCGSSGYLAAPAHRAMGTLNTATMASTRIAARHQPAVLYSANGAPGLPADVAAVCRTRPTRRVTLANTGKAAQIVGIAPQTDEWNRPASFHCHWGR